eukprot:Hpha_TRINITY_DN33917_c0_g1::TRINITY_DN33917_c0_g1_i1::g.69319::m.69319
MLGETVFEMRAGWARCGAVEAVVAARRLLFRARRDPRAVKEVREEMEGGLAEELRKVGDEEGYPPRQAAAVLHAYASTRAFNSPLFYDLTSVFVNPRSPSSRHGPTNRRYPTTAVWAWAATHIEAPPLSPCTAQLYAPPRVLQWMPPSSFGHSLPPVGVAGPPGRQWSGNV